MSVGLVCLKPAGPGVLLAMLVVWLVWQRAWRALAGIGVTLAVLGLSAGFFRPNWVWAWLTIGRDKVALTWALTYSPSIWGTVAKFLADAAYWPYVAGAICAVVVGAGLWAVRRVRLEDQWWLVVGLLAPMALMVTPYLWNYDHRMLLVPIMATVVLLEKARAPFVLVALWPFGIAVVSVGLLGVANTLGYDIWSVLLPVCVAAVFGAAWWYASKRKRLNDAISF